ncbi:MAG: GspH/FimT family pseudopilin [Thermodesulfobacteriota bacterium]
MKRQSGFTLIELLITIAILVTVTGIAIPAFGTWLPNYRLKAAAMDIYSNFQRAKMQAIRRNEGVVIVFDVGNDSYEVFVDNGAGGGTAEDDIRNGTEPLLAQVSMPENVEIDDANFSLGSSAPGFTSRGLPWKSRFGNVEIKNNKNRHYRVKLSIAGNLNIEVSHDGGATWK